MRHMPLLHLDRAAYDRARVWRAYADQAMALAALSGDLQPHEDHTMSTQPRYPFGDGPHYRDACHAWERMSAAERTDFLTHICAMRVDDVAMRIAESSIDIHGEDESSYVYGEIVESIAYGIESSSVRAAFIARCGVSR